MAWLRGTQRERVIRSNNGIGIEISGSDDLLHCALMYVCLSLFTLHACRAPIFQPSLISRLLGVSLSSNLRLSLLECACKLKSVSPSIGMSETSQQILGGMRVEKGVREGLDMRRLRVRFGSFKAQLKQLRRRSTSSSLYYGSPETLMGPGKFGGVVFAVSAQINLPHEQTSVTSTSMYFDLH